MCDGPERVCGGQLKVAMSHCFVARSPANIHVREFSRARWCASIARQTIVSPSRSVGCPCPSLRAPAAAASTWRDSMPPTMMCCRQVDLWRDYTRWRIAAAAWWRWDWECWVRQLPSRRQSLDSVAIGAVWWWAAVDVRFELAIPNWRPTEALARLRMRSCPSGSSQWRLVEVRRFV